jgi:hypothetical protein
VRSANLLLEISESVVEGWVWWGGWWLGGGALCAEASDPRVGLLDFFEAAGRFL